MYSPKNSIQHKQTTKLLNPTISLSNKLKKLSIPRKIYVIKPNHQLFKNINKISTAIINNINLNALFLITRRIK